MEFAIATVKTMEKAVRVDLQQGLIDQGHYLTGALDRSLNITPIVEQKGDSLLVEVNALDYIDTLDTGVPPEHIPTDAAYIQLMAGYAAQRFHISGKLALKAGYAIAKAHRREGNPTKNSYNFSKTGERLHVIEESFQEERYDILFDKGIDQEFDSLFNDTFDEISF